MIITCGTCGKGFVSDKGAARKYCSRKCYYQSQVGHAPTNPKRRENRECIVCGKGFETGGRAGKRKLFCSMPETVLKSEKQIYLNKDVF